MVLIQVWKSFIANFFLSGRIEPKHVVVHNIGLVPLGGEERYDVTSSLWKFIILQFTLPCLLLYVLWYLRGRTPVILDLLLHLRIVGSVLILGFLGENRFRQRAFLLSLHMEPCVDVNILVTLVWFLICLVA